MRPCDNLTRINSDLKDSKVSIIGISNDLRFTDFLDPRGLSSLSEEELVFPPYNAPQLCDILQQRGEDAFMEGVIDAPVIPLCAALAAQEHGDARRALDLLRVSGELAEREDTSRVAEKHVKMAQEKIETDSMIECVSTLPTQSKVVLYSMLLLEHIGKKIFTSGEVLQIYREVAGNWTWTCSRTGRITDLVSELSMLGVINTRVVSKGRYGRTKEMWFDMVTGRIWEASLQGPAPLAGYPYAIGYQPVEGIDQVIPWTRKTMKSSTFSRRTAELPLRELAASLALPEDEVEERIRAMEGARVIRRFTAVVDWDGPGTPGSRPSST